MRPLLNEALINNEPGEFSFSRRGEALIGQKMFEVLEMARRLEQQGQHVYHLELGNPRLAPPPELIEATIRSLSKEEVGYTYSAGHPVLRQAIADLYNRTSNRLWDESNVIISPANFIINQFLDIVCDPGDSVVLFTPAFPTYWAAAAHLELHVKSIELDPALGFDLREEDVNRALALHPQAIIVNSANNPTGAVYCRKVLERLAIECDRHGIWLLSDETYGPICFGREFYSLASMNFPRLVIMSSFSKIFSAPGFRTGFALAHPRVAEKFSLSTSTQISCMPIFSQLGCAAAIEQFETYTAKVTQRCQAIASWCSNELQKSSHVKFVAPQAGFYFFLDIGKSGMNDLTFSKCLLQQKHTAVTPGSSFGPAFGRFIRMATCGLENDVQEGTRRLAEFSGPK